MGLETLRLCRGRYNKNSVFYLPCQCEGGCYYLAYSEQYNSKSKIWVQLTKQFEIFERYLGIQAVTEERHSRRSFKLKIVPESILNSLGEISNNSFIIRDVCKFIELCNDALLEYYLWCNVNLVQLHRGLILPCRENPFWRDLF